jgi:hypothetical protein
MADYSIEPSRSNRANCRGKCHTKIEKGVLRIGVTTERGGYEDMCSYSSTRWYHLECFVFPAYMRQAGMTKEDFVRLHLKDTSDDKSVLPARIDEVLQGMKDTVKKVKPTKAERQKRRAAEKGTADEDDDDDNEEIQRQGNNKKTRREEEIESLMIEGFAVYETMTAVKLKEILGWNLQYKTGDKELVLTKVLDGHVHGRLGRCQDCRGGRLYIAEDGVTVICRGIFDEHTLSRVPCDYRGTVMDCPRWQPWCVSFY